MPPQRFHPGKIQCHPQHRLLLAERLRAVSAPDNHYKRYDEMEILWPGSGSFGWAGRLADEEPVAYVFGDAQDTSEAGEVIVPYAPRAYYEEHATHNLKMILENRESSRGRYYIVSAN